MKQLCLFLIVILFMTLRIDSNEISLEKPRHKDQMEMMKEFLDKESGKKVVEKIKLPKGPVFWEGWIKYFHYKSDPEAIRPNNFYKNNEFLRQLAGKNELKKKDSKGFVQIPTQFHFYSKLLLNHFNILSTRKLRSSSEIILNVDTLHIDNILPIKEGKKFKSSVRDLGNFAEGKCIQIFTNKPGSPNINFNPATDHGEKENWIICLETDKEKAKLLGIFANLKLIKQQAAEQKIKEDGVRPAPGQPETSAMVMERLKGTNPYEKRKDHHEVDGYWILLQDWSQCTRKCGGGNSYQHWMCVPPKKGGRACLGKAIRDKPCNRKRCPGTKTVGPGGLVKGSELNEVAKPIIKSLPFSARPQDFSICRVRENDVFHLIKDESTSAATEKMVSMPSRIVLNKRTISLYNDDSYENAVFAFKLKDTEIGIYTKDACCFNLQSGSRQCHICGGFGERCTGFVDGWIRDFNIFKTRCYVDLKDYNWQSAETKAALDAAMSGANLGNLEERKNLLNKKLHERELSSFEKKIMSTQNIALKAIKKELNIEKLLQAEVQMKAMLETKNLLAQRKLEAAKKDCLEKVLQDREVENQRLLENKSEEAQIQKLKEDAKKEVESKRENLRKKIAEIKAKAARRKRLIENDINVIRSQMAKTLSEANKSGDASKCVNAYGKAQEIATYCNAEVVDDYSRNLECKEPASFCYVCCETEFGNMFITQRDTCYLKCDALATAELDHGEFIWPK